MAETVKPAPVLDVRTRLQQANTTTRKAIARHSTTIEAARDLGRKVFEADKAMREAAEAVVRATQAETVALAAACPPAAPQASGPAEFAIEDLLEGGSDIFKCRSALAGELGSDLAEPDRKILVGEFDKFKASIEPMLKDKFVPALALLRTELEETAAVQERLQKRRKTPDSEERNVAATGSGGGAPPPTDAEPAAEPTAAMGGGCKGTGSGGAAAAAATDDGLGVDGDVGPVPTAEELRSQYIATATRTLGKSRA